MLHILYIFLIIMLSVCFTRLMYLRPSAFHQWNVAAHPDPSSNLITQF